ncbi:MAG TPA: hypothetical protein VKZ44_04835 [Taishania sp.]|nr:hypothetical protein [Taishania sp.]
MNIHNLLNNETVRGTLSKFGVSEDKQEAVLNQAYELVKSKALSNPQAISSLMSSKPNSAEDNQFQSLLQNDFVKSLIAKVGLSDDVAKQVSGALPELLKNFDLSMVTSLIDSFTSGDSKKSSSKGKSSGGGFMDLISNFLKKK